MVDALKKSREAVASRDLGILSSRIVLLQNTIPRGMCMMPRSESGEIHRCVVGDMIGIFGGNASLFTIESSISVFWKG